MFTGIVEKCGIVIANEKQLGGQHLLIAADFSDLKYGESIAVNGVCLTYTSHDNALVFDISPETLKITTLGLLKPGDAVNLERSMLAGNRFGGHYISGHVDAIAVLKEKKILDNYIEIAVGDFSVPASQYLLKKGSIALDGVSLTINNVENDNIYIMLIPHTINHTNLKKLNVGQRINVEFDYITRIVAHQLALKGSTVI